MQRLMGAVFACAAAVLLSLPWPDTLAQEKKPKAGTIEIIESIDGKFRFSVRDSEGRYLGGSAVGLPSEKAVKEVVEELKTVIATATYVSKKSKELLKDKDK